jgi:hypothetical protein
MILDTYDEWAQAQIAAIVEYFGINERVKKNEKSIHVDNDAYK